MSKRTENIVIENARLIFKNFAGEESKFNRKGNRNFCVILDGESADDLRDMGWNVKALRPRDDEDEPTYYLQVTVAFGNFPPKVIMIAGKTKTPLDEDSIDTLDYAEIANVDLIIRPYHWEVNGKEGRSAYLQAMNVIQNIDRFGAQYAAQDLPF